MGSLFESNKGGDGDCLGSHLVNQIDVMYNLYTLGVGAQITCNIYNVLKNRTKKCILYIHEIQSTLLFTGWILTHKVATQS